MAIALPVPMYYDLPGMKTWMKRAAVICALLTVPVLPAAKHRTMDKDARRSQVDALFFGLVAEPEPGAAVLVLKNGGIAFERGYGIAELRTLRRIDARTNFRLASFTKQFTAAAIMLLVRDGTLRYETRLGEIFPDFPEYGQPITIRQLLNHTSGLPDYEELMPPTVAGAPREIVQIRDGEVLELLKRQAAAKFAPGAQWAYSNSGYVVLGLVVEKISGRPFGRFLHDRIFAPLEMNRTLAYERGRNEVPDRAYGHSRGPDGWRQTDQSPTSATLGDGGVYSSLADLAKWDGALRRHLLLSEAEMRPALTPVRVSAGPSVEADGAAAAYGFGWFLNPWEGHDRMWHTGETMGFRTAIERFPKDGLTVVVLSNRGDLDAGALALKVAGVYFERE